MTHNGFPEYTSTTGQFRAEEIAPFIGQKAIVTITPVPPAGAALTSTVAAGIIAGAHRDRDRPNADDPIIYFQEGFKITVAQTSTDSTLTIDLIGVDGSV
jgi:hypothetical protein